MYLFSVLPTLPISFQELEPFFWPLFDLKMNIKKV